MFEDLRKSLNDYNSKVKKDFNKDLHVAKSND